MPDLFKTFVVLDYFDKGGLVMWPLLFLSIAAVTIIIERTMFFTRLSRRDRRFLKETKRAIREKQFSKVRRKSEKSHSPLTKITLSALLNRNRSREEVEKIIERVAQQQVAELERGLSILSSIGNLAPLLGFLGTVIGMIKSFDVIAQRGLEDPGLVAIGIKEALITTATGLIVAIPALGAYNYFTAAVISCIHRMEDEADLLIRALFDR